MRFPKCNESPLGIYPVVDRADKLRPLYECGITTAQLRVKDMEGKALEQEIIEAIRISEEFKARLFVNDYWQLAIEHDAYGIHLGQEDIREADVAAIFDAGIRLGISTHTPEEIDIALGFEPSYIAIGPVFVPISKELKYNTVGIGLLKSWAESVDYPVVAIGGITLDNIKEVAQTKAASGIAMISGVLEADKVSKEKTKVLIEVFETYGV
ncbi:thiamine-phosphate diphosphorylase [Sulfurovum lithotrophicum]|uniref:Thiamine-phosphate diphosphorylase n=1 Tax=Sulfurovum lithotrophicum TaxID=206403 RepID=A0A7U4RR46_9BACT|nr:thiamine phosphate synthase [Sulfurovum lithotrophicum]AKF25417.1 thiamine-phosphate diphosphorylase [Sulfurovum lithotrophicum]